MNDLARIIEIIPHLHVVEIGIIEYFYYFLTDCRIEMIFKSTLARICDLLENYGNNQVCQLTPLVDYGPHSLLFLYSKCILNA